MSLAVRRGAQQVFIAADDDALRGRFGGDYVERLGRAIRNPRRWPTVK